MNRVFLLTVVLLFFALSLRTLRKDATRVVLAKSIALYFAVSLTIYQTYTVLPILDKMFSILIFLNIVSCAVAVGLGSPKGMRIEPYLALFYAFLTYYVLSSIMGNYPVVLFAHKTMNSLYILAGVCVGRTILYYQLEDWFLRSTPYWAVPTVIILLFFVAPQVTVYSNTAVEGYQQLGDVELLNPNTFGLLVVPVYIMLVLAAVMLKSLPRRILCAVTAVLAFILLVRIGSRTSFMAAIVPSGYAMGYLIKNRILRAGSFMVLGVLLVYVFLFTQLSENYRVFSLVQDGEVSLSSRDVIWEDSLSAMTPFEQFIGTGGKIVQGLGGLGGGLEGLHSALMECFFTTGWSGSLVAMAALVLFFHRAWVLQHRGVFSVCFVLAGLLTGVGECALLRGHWLVTVFFGVGLGLVSSRECLMRKRFGVPAPLRAGAPPTGRPLEMH